MALFNDYPDEENTDDYSFKDMLVPKHLEQHFDSFNNFTEKEYADFNSGCKIKKSETSNHQFQEYLKSKKSKLYPDEMEKLKKIIMDASLVNFMDNAFPGNIVAPKQEKVSPLVDDENNFEFLDI